MRIPRIRLPRFLSGALVISSLVAYLLWPPDTAIPARWTTQFIGLWSAFAVLTILTAWTRDVVRRCAMLVVRLGLTIVLCRPLPLSTGVEQLLFASVVVDAAFSLTLPWRIVSYLVFTTSVFAVQGPVLIWRDAVPPPHHNELVLLAWVCGIVILGAELLRRYEDQNSESRRDFELQEVAMERLIDANLRYQEEMIRFGVAAAEKERSYLLGEIHDTVGHGMVNIMMLTEWLRDKVDGTDTSVSARLSAVRGEAQSVLQETERFLQGRRDAPNDRMYNLPEIKQLIDVFTNATGVSVRTEFRNSPISFGSTTDRVVYRFVQEALTNSFRHGRATRVEIGFWIEDGTAQVLVEDNGTGATNIHEGVGLWGIRQRLAAIGGALDVSFSGAGFRLKATFPLTAAGDD